MATDRDGGLVEAAGDLTEAVVDAVESGRASEIATGIIEDVTEIVAGGVETAADAVRNISREDITPDKIREAFAENAFDGVVALAGGAGVTLASAAVKAVYESAEGDPFAAIYAQLFNPDAAAPDADNTQAESPEPQGSFVERIMAGDIGGAFDLIKSKFTIFETLGGLLQSFVPNINIGGMIASVKGMLGIAEDRLTEQFAGVSNTRTQEEAPAPSAETVVAADESVPPTRPGEGALPERGDLTARQLAAAAAESNGTRDPSPAPVPGIDSALS